MAINLLFGWTEVITLRVFCFVNKCVLIGWAAFLKMFINSSDSGENFRETLFTFKIIGA